MLFATVVLWLALLLNLAGVKAFNTVLIVAGFTIVAVRLTVATLPVRSLIDRVAALDQYLLEIFPDQYVSVQTFHRLQRARLLPFLGMILAASIMLGCLANRLSARLFGRAGR